MTFDGTKEELASRLEWEKREVEKLGFALGLLVENRSEIDSMVYRITEWMSDACEALRGVETNRAKREAA